MADRRATIVVTGEIQKVGYRDYVQKVARKLGVLGYVENMRDGSVQVVCEAEESVIKEFKEAISVKVDFIDVNELNVLEIKEATGEFDYFEIKYGSPEEELGERMGAGILYMAATRDEINASRQDIKAMHSDLKAEAIKTHETLGSIDNRLDDALNRYDLFGKEITVIREDIGDLKQFAHEFSEFKDLFALYVKHEMSKDKA